MQTQKRNTPPEAREAVVVYRSVLETVHDAETPEEGNRILRDLLDCSFGYTRLEDVPNPNRMIIRPMLVSIEKAAARYDRAAADGRQGGRPCIGLDRAQLERDYAALGSWEKVAQKHGVSVSTLYRERKNQTGHRSIGQNLTKTYTKTNTNTSTYTSTSARPGGRSGARGAGEREFVTKKDPRKQLEQAFAALHRAQAKMAEEAAASAPEPEKPALADRTGS